MQLSRDVEDVDEKFKAAPRHLLPEISAISIAGILTSIVISSKIELETITVFPETPSGATLNMLIYVVPMAIVATAMYILVKYGLEKILKHLLKIAIVIVLFALLNWYTNALLRMTAIPSAILDTVLILSPILLTILMTYVINRVTGVIQIFTVTVLGAMIGTFLGTSIPTMTAVILLIGLSVYDMIAVYRGPIGKIAEKTELETLTGATFTYMDLTVGLGDVVFYTMLASHAMLNFGLTAYLVTSVGLLVGTFLGFKMLERRDMFPGLPFSLISGLVLMLATAWAQGRAPL
jgi:presenilin-like A22 family membrane protease